MDFLDCLMIVGTLAVTIYAEMHTRSLLYTSDPLEVHDILHFGYCEDRSVTSIQATSSGELNEWSNSPSWLEKDVPALNKTAVGQGKTITRILILRPTEQLVHAESAVFANSGVGVVGPNRYASEQKPVHLCFG